MDVYRDNPSTARVLRELLQRMDEPPRIAVVGPARSGKSTVVSAVVGADVAPVEVLGGIQVPVWYQDGPVPRVTVYPSGDDLPTAYPGGGLRVEPEHWPAEPVDEVVVDWPSRTLRRAMLIDTPPADTILTEVSREADALLYLTRDVSGADLGPLRSTVDDQPAWAEPIHTVVVLSRADEVGGGRIDALISARQIARRYRRDAAARELCQHVVSLAGLVAHAGQTLTEAEFAALAGLAATPREELEDRLLSTDRFLGPDPETAEANRVLLERFGIFGIRLATTLIRTRYDTAAKLSTELVRRSGLTELREAIGHLFLDRHDVLQARSTLVALDHIVRKEPRPTAGPLAAEIERIVAGAHAFQELRLIGELHAGRVAFPGDLSGEARTLVGGQGTSVPARLEAGTSATDAELWVLATQALEQWQGWAANPALGQRERRAARVVVRSCEGIVTTLSQG